MAPPQVVQVLSKKPGANVGLVRDYIIRKCEANRQLTVEVRTPSVCRRHLRMQPYLAMRGFACVCAY